MTMTFKSFLSLRLEEYVNYRKTLGFKKASLKSHLKKFDRYLLSVAPQVGRWSPKTGQCDKL